jgi:type II secretory pathway pseudopilin PulG
MKGKFPFRKFCKSPVLENRELNEHQKPKVSGAGVGGFTLIDVLVGTALMLIVFLGIFGAYQLGIKVIGQSKNRISATAIATQQMELIKNLPYESVGVKNSFPDGVLEPLTSTFQNGIEYIIETRVDFVIDPADGLAYPEDECPNDYKKVEVKVSFGGKFPGEVKMVTDMAPKNLAQECAISGGIISVAVFDALGIMVPSPLIEVRDPATDQTIKSALPPSGQHYFSLATSTYKIVVSKEGYSSERTYGPEEIASPEKPHVIVLEDQITEVSFSIDKISNFSVDTLSPWGQGIFSDSFLGDSKIAELNNVELNSGQVALASTTEGYLAEGYLISTAISPADMLNWDEFSFTDLEPFDTDLKYQIYYATNSAWLLVPDTDLAQNSEGLDSSPVDLSELAGAKYATLRIKANFTTLSTSTTPVLEDWQVSWITSQPTPIPNKTFKLQGTKTLGTDQDEEVVYKYSQNHTSDSQGHVDIFGLEWDAYTFSIAPESGLDLAQIAPSPQPILLSPDTSLNVELYLEAENSFLVTLQNQETLEPIFAGTVRLSNLTLEYDTTQYTDTQGQTYFIPLTPATYHLEIQAPGYLPYSSDIWLSGDVIRTIKLEQVE